MRSDAEFEIVRFGGKTHDFNIGQVSVLGMFISDVYKYPPLPVLMVLWEVPSDYCSLASMTPWQVGLVGWVRFDTGTYLF